MYATPWNSNTCVTNLKRVHYANKRQLKTSLSKNFKQLVKESNPNQPPSAIMPELLETRVRLCLDFFLRCGSVSPNTPRCRKHREENVTALINLFVRRRSVQQVCIRVRISWLISSREKTSIAIDEVQSIIVVEGITRPTNFFLMRYRRS